MAIPSTARMRSLHPGRSLARIQGLSPHQVDEFPGEILLRVQAFPPFDPLALAPAEVCLQVALRDENVSIAGRLEIIDPLGAEGIWYVYRFVPQAVQQELIKQVLFRGLCRFSNIREIELALPDSLPQIFANSFFQDWAAMTTTPFSPWKERVS